ncbi:6665_t:CDS:1, partial [Racocetra fulgida]
KTGITISGDVTKNADGLEDVDAFFEAANSTTKIDETTTTTIIEEVSMSLVTD